MDYSRILIAVAIMAAVTYLPRVLPILLFTKPIKSPFLRSFLLYVPYAVLGAMTFPDIFYSTTYIISALMGLICALALSFLRKDLLTVAVCAVLVSYISERVIEYFI